MKKQMYYQTMFRRRNVIKEALLNFFLGLSSYPRLLLEVFIRRNMGERYFSLSSAITVFIFLVIIPVLAEYGTDIFSSYARDYHRFYWDSFLRENATWYLLAGGFLYMAFKRHEEIKRLPSVFDFKRFSLSTGSIHPRFFSIELGGKPANVRTIETLLEPALFFLIGFFFWIIGQNVGTLLMISSLIYSISYQATYHRGDHFIMDKIDETITNEELAKAFIEGRKPSETRGFTFYGRRPDDVDTRRRIADLFTEKDDRVMAL